MSHNSYILKYYLRLRDSLPITIYLNNVAYCSDSIKNLLHGFTNMQIHNENMRQLQNAIIDFYDNIETVLKTYDSLIKYTDRLINSTGDRGMHPLYLYNEQFTN